MDYPFPPLEVRVWGPWACFTRPEMKVERVTYAVPTPSAARGILEAIFWRPQFTWDVQEIWLLTPIRYASILRNEVESKVNVATVRRWADEGGGFDIQSDRTQRNALILRDVDYVLRAQVRVNPDSKVNPAKFRDQFRRRVRRGQCFTRPYLGCREFAASFAPPRGDEHPIALTQDLGRMLWDLDYSGNGDSRARPHFFDARIEQGVVRFPALESWAV